MQHHYCEALPLFELYLTTLQTSACLLLTIQYITNINIDGMVPQGPSHLRVYEEKSGGIDNTKNCIWSSLMPNQAVSGRTGEDTWVVPLLVPEMYKKKVQLVRSS